MIITDLCELYATLYTDLQVPAGTWTHVVPKDGAYCAVLATPLESVVAFRGSVTLTDWLEDFMVSLGAPQYEDPQLGPLHLGFAVGVRSVQNALDALVPMDRPLTVVGHSLGAGHALIYAARRRKAGLRVDAVTTFGSPRPGGAGVAEALAGVHQTSYRNSGPDGHDLVTDVPFAAPPILRYQHPAPLTDVSAVPSSNDPWLAFRYHHFGLYCRALGASGPVARSLPT